ncbi:hypothetical protein PFLG_00116 [Plasmodium falciparum RAJ116]|uniref:Uncharacterized protein n=1 Tax=Plasmodium falciparum RAJ116 TaxID=580058 RepID=A0A0L0CUU6_PLAFA|nr:hypothetical protein PFLG_00116 [Plasmodium falciparum RAJ116]
MNKIHRNKKKKKKKKEYYYINTIYLVYYLIYYICTYIYIQRNKETSTFSLLLLMKDNIIKNVLYKFISKFKKYIFYYNIMKINIKIKYILIIIYNIFIYNI